MPAGRVEPASLPWRRTQQRHSGPSPTPTRTNSSRRSGRPSCAATAPDSVGSSPTCSPTRSDSEPLVAPSLWTSTSSAREKSRRSASPTTGRASAQTTSRTSSSASTEQSSLGRSPAAASDSRWWRNWSRRSTVGSGSLHPTRHPDRCLASDAGIASSSAIRQSSLIATSGFVLDVHRGWVSYMRTAATSPEMAVRAATVLMAAGMEMRSERMPARSAPTAKPPSRHSR